MTTKAPTWEEMFGLPKELAVKKVDCPFCDPRGYSKEHPEWMCEMCGGHQELFQNPDGSYIPR